MLFTTRRVSRLHALRIPPAAARIRRSKSEPTLGQRGSSDISACGEGSRSVWPADRPSVPRFFPVAVAFVPAAAAYPNLLSLTVQARLQTPDLSRSCAI